MLSFEFDCYCLFFKILSYSLFWVFFHILLLLNFSFLSMSILWSGISLKQWDIDLFTQAFPPRQGQKQIHQLKEIILSEWYLYGGVSACGRRVGGRLYFSPNQSALFMSKYMYPSNTSSCHYLTAGETLGDTKNTCDSILQKFSDQWATQCEI